MQLSEEIRSNHRYLAPAAETFVEYLLSRPEAHKSALELYDIPEGLRFVTYQSWPTLIDQRFAAEIDAVGAGLLRLFHTIPERLFDNDPSKLAAQYPFRDVAQAELILRPPVEYQSLVARWDLVLTHHGWKCLEGNINPALGGSEAFEVGKVMAQHPLVSDFLQQHDLRLSSVDATLAFYAHVIEEVQRITGPSSKSDSEKTVNPAVWLHPKADRAFVTQLMQDDYAQALAQLGGGVEGELLTFVERDEVEIRDNTLFVDGKRVHCLCAASAFDLPDDVIECAKAGSMVLLGGPLDMTLHNKCNLHLLSSQADSGRFSDEEREFIHRHIPWSRAMMAGRTTYGEEKVELLDFVLGQRQQLVLKPAVGYGGMDVVMGLDVDDTAWRAAVEKAVADGGWLVQELADSRRYLYHHDGRPTEHRLVWGAFCIGRQAAGCMLRMVPANADSAVVNVQQGAELGAVLVLD